MKYQMINEELQIASCSIADLTMEQAEHFLKQWEPGASIGTLTLFYDETGLVVLNRDNKYYDYYKKFAETYLAIPDEETRKRLAGKLSERLCNEKKVLENCITLRTVGREVDRALKNYIPGDIHYRVLREIYRRYDNSVVVATTAFRYGVMVGKRIERAKRKH